MEPEFERSSFKKWLALYDMQLTFTKLNGETRVMQCTLRPEALPPVTTPLNTEEPEYLTDAIRVWDLEKKAWRSFIPSKVTEAIILFHLSPGDANVFMPKGDENG